MQMSFQDMQNLYELDKGVIVMKIKFHNLDNFTSYVAKNRIECRSDLDKSLWDMHQQVFDRCWCCGEMVAEKV